MVIRFLIEFNRIGPLNIKTFRLQRILDSRSQYCSMFMFVPSSVFFFVLFHYLLNCVLAFTVLHQLPLILRFNKDIRSYSSAVRTLYYRFLSTARYNVVEGRPYHLDNTKPLNDFQSKITFRLVYYTKHAKGI